MLTISDNLINKYKNKKVTVYSTEFMDEGSECFANNGDSLFAHEVYLHNIKFKDGRFYFTNEDLSQVCDFYPADILPVIGAFVKGKKKCVSNSFVVDVSKLPAFSTITNEDTKVYEYRLYITLFNDYTLKQCQYERHNLFDAKYSSSKFDLESRVQNSDFLKSKDFTVINVKRKDEENIFIGYIIREPEESEYSCEYGKLFIDMNNKIFIRWH